MTAFYEALSKGMTKAEALQAAQLALIDEAHPVKRTHPTNGLRCG
jgi:CHAT domain-containing protein